MKQTKRLLALLLSAALCVSFAACSSSAGNPSGADNTTDATATTENGAGDSGVFYEDGSESASDIVFVCVEGDTLTMRIEGEPITLMGRNIAFNPMIQATFYDASGSSLGRVVLRCVEGSWSGDFDNFASGQTASITEDYEKDAMQLSFSISESGLDVSALAGLSLSIDLIDLDTGEGEMLYMAEDYAMQLDLGDAADAQDSEAAGFLEKFVGTYYVYNTSEFTDPLLVTADTLTFMHGGEPYECICEDSALVATEFEENCIVFTQGEDNVVVCFTFSDTAYVTVYINCADDDTGESAGYSYRMEDEVSVVDEAFIQANQGEYIDVESGTQACNLGLYSGGFLGYTGSDGVSYTVDSILGATLVNGDTVSVTLEGSDGSTLDVEIWFGEGNGARRVVVNHGWVMEATE